MAKKKKKKGNFKSIAPNSREILLILLTFIITYFGPKYFEKPKIDIIDMGLMKVNDTLIQKYYLLVNNSNNTAKNIELHLKELDNGSVIFTGGVVTLKKDDYAGGFAKNKFYEITEFPHGLTIGVIIHVNFSNYLKINNIDTLILNKPIIKPRQYYGPYIQQLKHSDGIEIPHWENTLTLTELR